MTVETGIVVEFTRFALQKSRSNPYCVLPEEADMKRLAKLKGQEYDRDMELHVFFGDLASYDLGSVRAGGPEVEKLMGEGRLCCRFEVHGAPRVYKVGQGCIMPRAQYAFLERFFPGLSQQTSAGMLSESAAVQTITEEKREILAELDRVNQALEKAEDKGGAKDAALAQKDVEIAQLKADLEAALAAKAPEKKPAAKKPAAKKDEG